VPTAIRSSTIFVTW